MSTVLSRLSRTWAKSLFSESKNVANHRLESAFFTPRLEGLEERTVFAANVVSSQAGSVLTLTAVDVLGDQAAILAGDNNNKLTVTRTGANAYTIAGTDANNTVDSIATKNFTGITGIVLKLGLGNDEVTFSTPAPQATPLASLTYFGGDGNNSLTFDGTAGNNLLSNVSVTNGDGSDTLRFLGGTNAVTSTLKVTNGNGDSFIELGNDPANVTSLGTVSVTNGAGFDELSAVGSFHATGLVTLKNGNGGSSTNFNTSSLQLDKAFSLTNGSGLDEVLIGGVGGTVNLKNVTISNSNGGSNVGVNAASTINGNLAITNGVGNDTFQVVGPSFHVTGTLAIKNGSGNSITNLEAGVNKVDGGLSITNLDGFDAGRFGASSGASSVAFKSVTIKNGVGGSKLEFVATTSTIISGPVAITNGAGVDEFKTAGASFAVTGSFAISNGSGDSTTAFEADDNNVDGALSITNTDGDDSFRVFNNVTSACVKVTFDAVTIKNGAGASTVAIGGDNSTSTMKSLSISSGEGLDQVGVSRVNTANNVSVNIGRGGMEVESLIGLGAIPGSPTEATDAASIGGNLSILGTDRNIRLRLNRVSVTGTTAITTGNGLDVVEIRNSAFTKAVTIKTGANNDSVAIEVDNDGATTTTTFNGTISVNLGSGDDQLNVGTDVNNKAVFTLAPIKFEGGVGIDTFTKSTAGTSFGSLSPLVTNIEVEITNV